LRETAVRADGTGLNFESVELTRNSIFPITAS
jgi:hypothetical protein